MRWTKDQRQDDCGAQATPQAGRARVMRNRRQRDAERRHAQHRDAESHRCIVRINATRVRALSQPHLSDTRPAVGRWPNLLCYRACGAPLVADRHGNTLRARGVAWDYTPLSGHFSQTGASRAELYCVRESLSACGISEGERPVSPKGFACVESSHSHVEARQKRASGLLMGPWSPERLLVE